MLCCGVKTERAQGETVRGLRETGRANIFKNHIFNIFRLNFLFNMAVLLLAVIAAVSAAAASAGPTSDVDDAPGVWGAARTPFECSVNRKYCDVAIKEKALETSCCVSTGWGPARLPARPTTTAHPPVIHKNDYIAACGPGLVFAAWVSFRICSRSLSPFSLSLSLSLLLVASPL